MELRRNKYTESGSKLTCKLRRNQGITLRRNQNHEDLAQIRQYLYGVTIRSYGVMKP